MKIKAQDLANALKAPYEWVTMDSDGKVGIYAAEPHIELLTIGGQWNVRGRYLGDVITGSNVDFGTDDWTKCIVRKEKPFEITETGLYKTRAGKKAFVSIIEDGRVEDHSRVSYVIEGCGNFISCAVNGRVCRIEQTDRDIICEWGEE